VISHLSLSATVSLLLGFLVFLFHFPHLPSLCSLYLSFFFVVCIFARFIFSWLCYGAIVVVSRVNLCLVAAPV
jgi:hypothetical protein